MSTEFKIQKSIPIPGYGYAALAKRYPFREMKVGDSFAVVAKDDDILLVLVNKMRQAACVFARRNPGYKFITRQIKTKNEVRIWRIEPELVKQKEVAQ